MRGTRLVKRDVDCELKYASNGAVRDVVNRGAGGVDTWMVSGYGDGAVNCGLCVQNGMTEWFLVGPTPFLGHLTTVSRRRGRSVFFCGIAANSTFRLDLASDLSFVPFSFSPWSSAFPAPCLLRKDGSNLRFAETSWSPSGCGSLGDC